jgi:predicted TPR repeat methyltransferase/Flp pilus assembly protein TadD
METQPNLAKPPTGGREEEGCYVAVREWSSKDPWFSGMLKIGIPTVQALTRLGFKLLRENNSPEALAVFRSAMALSPNDSGLWHNCGLALSRMNLLKDAVECLERSVTLARQNHDAWLLLGSLRKTLGDSAGAETAYRLALEQQPDSALGWQCLGLISQEKGAYVEAIDCFTACIRHGGATASVWASLGNLYYQTGRVLEAHRAFSDAGALNPTDPNTGKMLRSTRFLKEVLQGASVDDALRTYRASLAPADGPYEQNLQELLMASFTLLRGFGHTEAAILVARKRSELWPQDPSAAYLLAAITGQDGPDRSPPDYIVNHFDDFAERFDAKLVDTLGYDVPRKLISAVQSAMEIGRLYDTLDAGCGTGLCGPLLRPLARDLIGVDLSPKMLEQAAKRGVYRELVCEEISAFLSRSRGCFDLLVAADVLIYFGDLVPVLSAAACALRPGGLLAFSTELSTSADHRLQPSGRFAHTPAYVRSASGKSFAEHACVETTIRLEATERVRGNLFVFRRV